MSYLRQARSGHSWWVAVLWLAVGLTTATQVVVGTAGGRLVTLYGANSTVELRNGEPTGVETTVKVPYRPIAYRIGA